MDSLEWLQNEGHRSTFDMLWKAMDKLTIKEVKEYLRDEVVTDERDEAIMMHRLRNLRDTKEVFALYDPSFTPDMLIWDYGRIINLCRGCYDAGYLDAEFALDTIVNCGAVLKKTYSSWRHLSLSYQFTRFIWKGFDDELFIEGLAAMEMLLMNAGSPWVTLGWAEEVV